MISIGSTKSSNVAVLFLAIQLINTSLTNDANAAPEKFDVYAAISSEIISLKQGFFDK